LKIIRNGCNLWNPGKWLCLFWEFFNNLSFLCVIKITRTWVKLLGEMSSNNTFHSMSCFFNLEIVDYCVVKWRIWRHLLNMKVVQSSNFCLESARNVLIFSYAFPPTLHWNGVQFSFYEDVEPGLAWPNKSLVICYH